MPRYRTLLNSIDNLKITDLQRKGKSWKCHKNVDWMINNFVYFFMFNDWLKRLDVAIKIRTMCASKIN